MHYKLSVTLIVKNEEIHLPNILRNISIFADEIVIIDTGSTDKTIEIAKSITKNVYRFKWIDDFSKARNYGISKCTGDFIMWLDADDMITDADAKKIKKLMQNEINWDVCYILYKVGNYLIKRERIFRNNGLIKFVHPIHECLKFDGFSYNLDINNITIIHNKIHENENGNERNLRILLKTIKKKQYKSDARIWSHLGAEYRQKGDTINAIYAYTKALKFDKDNYRYYYNLGILYKLNNEINLSLKNFWQSVEKNPLIREVYFEIGKIYYDLDKMDQALFIFLSILNIKHNKDRFMIDINKYNDEYIYDWISLIYGKKGEYKNALKYVNLALKRNISDSRLLSNKNFWQSKLEN